MYVQAQILWKNMPFLMHIPLSTAGPIVHFSSNFESIRLDKHYSFPSVYFIYVSLLFERRGQYCVLPGKKDVQISTHKINMSNISN
jgi:hypothetical protein